jgi:diacylglycerol kinase family enzyme
MTGRRVRVRGREHAGRATFLLAGLSEPSRAGKHREMVAGRSSTAPRRDAAARPSARRRLAAFASILLNVAGLVLVVYGVGSNLGWVLLGIVLLFAGVFAGWLALTRTGWRRVFSAIVCVAVLIGVVVLAVVNERADLRFVIAGLVLLMAGGASGRFALGRDLRTLKGEPTSGRRVSRATRGVLLINPRSGGGKADRVGLVGACHERGIEPVVLEQGADLRALAIAEVERGADVIGMAGGDGSQAIVASVAAEHGIPHVVVPTGTRNHLALDLGLDRDDILGALDAYDYAVERRMDLGDVGGKVFVNNVSLGVYASIVRSPEYRDAKVDTTLSALPMMLGPGSEPFDLVFTGPDGRTHRGAHLIQVSNNPYGRSPLTSASRPSLETHRLGVVSLELDGDLAAGRFLSAVATGHPERYEGFSAWTPSTFEVRSESAIDVGLDGESMTLDPPLRFSIRSDVLRVRLPFGAIGESPAGRTLDVRSTMRGVWRVAWGRPAAEENGRATA